MTDMFSFLKSYTKEKESPICVSKQDPEFAFILNVPYHLNEHGVIWARAQYLRFGNSFKKMTSIDCEITQKLKIFLNGLQNTDGTFLILSDNLINSSTVCLIAQADDGQVLSFDFVKANKGCDFKGIVEQEID